MAKGNSSLPAVIAWNQSVASDPKKVQALNKKPIDLTKDQMIQLYLMLYPFIATDFVHRNDIQKYIQEILDELQKLVDDFNTQVQTLKQELDQHMHIGNLGSPTSPPTAINPPFTKPMFKLWKQLPEDNKFKYGEELIIESSIYSKNIKHRKPDTDAPLTKTKLKISTEFAQQLKLVPFDASGNESPIEEENEFSGS